MKKASNYIMDVHTPFEVQIFNNKNGMGILGRDFQLFATVLKKA